MDNVKSRFLNADGTYFRPTLAEGDTPFRVQERLLALRPAVTTATSEMRLAGAERHPALAAESNGVSEEIADGNGVVHGEQFPTRAISSQRDEPR
jgi:hypothetical protein